MELSEKVDKLSLDVERNKTEILVLQETSKAHGKEINDLKKFAIASQASQEARDKSLNRTLAILTVVILFMPVASAYLQKLING